MSALRDETSVRETPHASASVLPELQLLVDLDTDTQTPIGVVAYGLSSEELTAVREMEKLPSMFVLRVLRAPSLSSFECDDDLPAIFGRYQVTANTIRFTPYFPFEPGLSYRAHFDIQALRGFTPDEVSLVFSTPGTAEIEPTEVLQVFPTGETIPENLLRLYVRFSNSMQRGHCESQITLLGADGEPVTDVLYRPPVELWDRSMRFLTVLLDPGRLKRYVGPNRALGPPLSVGAQYQLRIGPEMLDCTGRPLTGPFYKTFTVAYAERRRIEPDGWEIAHPVVGTRDRLVLDFPQAMDWALLSQAIHVIASTGTQVAGLASIDDDEQRWSFTPDLAWVPGAYRIDIDSILEDICGNSLLAAFDRPLRQGSNLEREGESCSISFELE